MPQNAYLLAKVGADTAENEQHFAEILPIGRRVADRCDDLRRREGAVAGRLDFDRHLVLEGRLELLRLPVVCLRRAGKTHAKSRYYCMLWHS